MKLKSTVLGITCAIATSVVFAQTETTTTTTGTGTITEYSPGSAFVVKETSGPVNYRYGEKVTYVTRSGKSLPDDEVRTHVKVGIPLRPPEMFAAPDHIEVFGEPRELHHLLPLWTLVNTCKAHPFFNGVKS